LNLNLWNTKAPLREQEPLAYLIPAGQGRDENVAKLISILVAQGVEVYRLDKELHAGYGVQMLNRISFSDKAEGAIGISIEQKQSVQEVPAGSYLIYLQQPARSNIRALLEPQAYPDRRTGRGEVERPYDVAGWTLPLQMNVEAYSVTEIREAQSDRRLSLVRDEAEVRRDLGLAPATGNRSPIANPLKQQVRLGVYRSWFATNIDEGWTRYVFDTFNVPYKTLRDADVRRGNLRSRYDVIILPSQKAKEIVEGQPPGSYPAQYTDGITRAGVEALRSFVNEGGTLICFDASSEFAIKEFNLPLRNVLEGVAPTDFYCPGSILQLDVDTSNPIARGFDSKVGAYFINSSAFEIKEPERLSSVSGESKQAERVRVVARYSADGQLLRSGWLLGGNRIAGRIALAEVTMSKGRVILFAFRPQHRAQTWGTFPFIFNAIMAGKS
jgi:hypothetical protein